MKINDKCLRILFVIFILSSPSEAQVSGFKRIKWERERIIPGLIWKSSHTILNDSVKQNINILSVNTRRRDISLIYDPGKNAGTSEQASQAEAIAAVNAGFFNIKNGGSATYIKVNGMVIDSDTARKWQRVANMNGSVIIDYKGKVSIAKAMQNSWYDANPDLEDALITGPLLVAGKKKAALPETSLVINKHPRTCIGTKRRNKVILVTLDGRTDQAAGMTLPELSDLMISLKCTSAVNLDGGGSTTMWISGKPFNGVVNMPCDNRKFDHEGERAVSDIIIVR